MTGRAYGGWGVRKRGRDQSRVSAAILTCPDRSGCGAAISRRGRDGQGDIRPVAATAPNPRTVTAGISPNATSNNFPAIFGTGIRLASYGFAINSQNHG